MPKVSVIVPIYNVSKYLDRSIQSIINQSLKELEILLINDGSTDNSLSICNKYKEKDSRVKVFSKENGGVSSARNLGIEKSNGEFLAFVDPDDWIKSDMFEVLYSSSIANNTEIIICDYIVESGNNKKEVTIDYYKDIFDRTSIINFLIPNMIGQDSFNSYTQNIMGSVCRLMIRKEFLITNNVRFREDISLMEDLIFCIEIFLKSKKINYLKRPYYHYIKNSNSALTSYRENTMNERKKIIQILSTIFNKYNLQEFYEKRMKYRYIKNAIISISNETRKGNKNTFTKKIQTIKNICEDKTLIKYIDEIPISDYNKKTKLLLKFIKYKMSMPLYFYYKFKGNSGLII